jgi:cation diffusion facilitator family transporter
MYEIIIQEPASKNKQKAAKKSTLISAAVNILLASAQILAGIFSGSGALVADGIHSLADLFSDFIVLFANHHGSKDADEDHHYGHQRYENAASLFLGLSLLGVGLLILYSAGHKIIFAGFNYQVQIQALWVALINLAVKEVLFRYMLAVATKVRSSMLVVNAWHARSDAVSSLLVAIGIAGALMGYPILDSIAALIVGLIITKTGFEFAWNSLHDLMDRAAPKEETAKIHELIIATPKVKGCHNLRTRKMGDMIFVDVHIELDGKMTVQESHDITAKMRAEIIARLPVIDMMIHIDPSLFCKD